MEPQLWQYRSRLFLHPYRNSAPWPWDIVALPHLKWFSTFDAGYSPADAGSQSCQSALKKQLGPFAFSLYSYAFLSLSSRFDFWFFSPYPFSTCCDRPLTSVLLPRPVYYTWRITHLPPPSPASPRPYDNCCGPLVVRMWECSEGLSRIQWVVTKAKRAGQPLHNKEVSSSKCQQHWG